LFGLINPNFFYLILDLTIIFKINDLYEMKFNILMMNKLIEDKWVTILGCLLMFSVQFIANMVIVALPSIAVDLNLSIEMENAINLVFLITSVSLMIPLSTYVSKYGISKFLKISILLMIFALLLSAFSTNINILLFSRFIQGIATAIINTSVYVIVTLQMPSDKLGYVLGLMGSFGYVGLCLSNTVSGIVVYFLNWRAVFLILLPVYIAMLVILFKLDKEWYTDHIKITDHLGSILYVLFMGLFLYGITKLDNNNFTVIIVSFIILVIFLYYENHISNPRYDLSIFKNIKFVLGNFSAFVMYFMTFIASYILNYYLQYVLGYDSVITGLFLLTTPVAVVLVSIFAGKLSDKIDERILSSVALMFILIDVCLLFFMDVIPIYLLLAACILQGIGHGMFSSPNNRFVLTQVSEKDLSNASAILSTNKDVGKGISLALYSIICGFILGTSERVVDDISSFLISSKITLTISIVLGIIALVLLILNKIKD